MAMPIMPTAPAANRELIQEAQAAAAGLREAALSAGGALTVRLNQAAALLEQMAPAEPEEDEGADAQEDAPDSLGQQLMRQRMRILDTRLTAECIRLAMVCESEDPDYDAAGAAESALRLVSAYLQDIEDQLEAIEGAMEVRS